MSGPQVAVVGAGAWGTTLAVMLGKVEPVVLESKDELADFPAWAERIRVDGG
jgi:glycerol-3-phosphate dehydrogenase